MANILEKCKKKGRANSRIFFFWIIEKKNLKQCQLAGERSEAKERKRSEAWQEVFLYWFPQTVKKVSKRGGKKTLTRQFQRLFYGGFKLKGSANTIFKR